MLSPPTIAPSKNVNQPHIAQRDVVSDSVRELVPLIRPPVVVEAFALLLLIGFLAKSGNVKLLVFGVTGLVGVNVLHVVSQMRPSSVTAVRSSCLVILMFAVALKRPNTRLALFSLAL